MALLHRLSQEQWDVAGAIATHDCHALGLLSIPVLCCQQLSVSIGVALFPAAGSNADALYRAAQAALQTAKDTCRGTYVFSGPGTPENPESA